MPFHALLVYVSALLSIGVVAVVLAQDARSFAHRTFALGMMALALREVCVGLSLQAVLPGEALRWARLGFIPAAFLPGSWLLFSVSFARADYKAHLAIWRWGVVVAFALPCTLVALFHTALLSMPLRVGPASRGLPLAWSGYVFLLFYLLVAVAILMNLEGTLRASTGSKRWQLKFLVLGLGGVLAIHIYTVSQALMFSSVTTAGESLHAGALIVADGLIFLSLGRTRHWNLDIYLSPGALYNTITFSVVGIYLLGVGVLAKAITYVGGLTIFPLSAFFVFLALISLTIVLLSDQLRHTSKQLISRHFSRPRYDYRTEWMAFSKRTTSLMSIPELCTVASRIVAELFGVPAVTLWLLDETGERLTLGGSTVLSAEQARHLPRAEPGSAALIRAVHEQSGPIDCAGARAQFPQDYTDYLCQAQIRYAIPLVAGQQLVGLMTLNTRLTKEPFSQEDTDLLKTIADQATASLLHLRLAERLVQAKELEAFQTLSTFFVHDLKNLAAKMSLVLQNLPEHYDDAAFRHDVLRLISDSMGKMNALCSRLTLLTPRLELHRTEVDLNRLVRTTLAELRDSLKTRVGEDLHALPTLLLDAEQIEKVLTNLLLNAHDAVTSDGEMWVSTRQKDGWVVLAVHDHGCGMSRAFVEQCLFQPFRTTKSHGLGIGLFHTKMIVEAHQGRLEVDSEEGKGSTFRVLLPLTCAT